MKYYVIEKGIQIKVDSETNDVGIKYIFHFKDLVKNQTGKVTIIVENDECFNDNSKSFKEPDKESFEDVSDIWKKYLEVSKKYEETKIINLIPCALNEFKRMQERENNFLSPHQSV